MTFGNQTTYVGQLVDYRLSNLGLPVLSPGDSKNWKDHKEIFKTACE